MISSKRSRLADQLRSARQRQWHLRDTSYRTDDAVVAGLGVPVLAVVPEMLTLQQRHVRRRARMVWRLAMIVAAVAAASAAWVMFG
jgi:hypothetical protein